MAKKPSIANPNSVGFLGFGMTAILLNLHNAGLIPLTVITVATCLALGGTAQIIAGIMAFARGDTFGATAFTAYGLFWWSLMLSWIAPLGSQPAESMSMGVYMLLWTLFTVCMFIATFKQHKAAQVLYGLLTLLYVFLTIASFTESQAVNALAGYTGVLCGLSAIYNAVAPIINGAYRKEILPMGRPKKGKKK